MNLRYGLRVIGKAAQLGFRQVFADKIILLGSFLVYLTIMVLYSGIIKQIPLDEIAPYGLSHAHMIWYMGTAEIVLFMSVGWSYKEVQHEIKTEQIYLSLLRPFPSSLLRVSMWGGEASARFIIYFPLYLLLMYELSDSFNLSLPCVIGAIFSISMGVFMLLCGNYFVGASCLWIDQSEIAHFFWQKFVFLFGALLWPIIFYPDWMKPILWVTPFPAILATTGNWALDFTFMERVLMVLHQLCWGLGFFVLLSWYDLKILQRIQKGRG